MQLSDDIQLRESVGNGDHRQGAVDAPVTLLQYGDYQCEDCYAAYPVLKRIQATMGDSLQFVFRNFPLNHEHAHAQQAAEAAESAAAQGKFWQMHDALYEQQDDLVANGLDGILRIAASAEVDLERLKQDLESRRFKARVDNDHATGVASGVTGTPTFFIDGRRCDVGEDYEALLPILQRLAGASA